MAEGKHLLPGFNHNVRHLGQLYHVQTEDSGAANPHVTTHLFLGGNVLASKKTGYGDLLGQVDAAVRVQQLMQAQHKEMLRQLVKGAFDGQLAAGAAAARSYAPGELAEDAAEAPLPAAAPEPAPTPEPPRLPRAPRPPATAAPAAAPASPAAARPVTDGWGPPVLPRVPHPPAPAARPTARAPAAPPAPPPDRRLDELILTYLAEDLGAKPRGR